MKKNFDVTGMACSACSNRVEKAVAGVPGVEDVSVNLLKNSMTVNYDETKTGLEQIIQAVTNAGYGANGAGNGSDGRNAASGSYVGDKGRSYQCLDTVPLGAARCLREFQIFHGRL